MPFAPSAVVRATAVVAALAALAVAAPAQIAAPLEVPLRAAGDWRTLEVPGFAFHYPAPLETWTRRQAERMAAVGGAVAGLVGHEPRGTVTVLVEDPYNVSNGSAYPFLDAPSMFLWPVPPDPRSVVGDSRDWGELLLVHEYAHLAHLARPSRNPLRRLVGRVVPAALSPIAARTPRWAFEGYATFVEGRLTGSGRPHGAWRPAILRQWAIEGRLPTYAQVSGGGGFFGGSMAYLAGSTYFEWLVDRHAGARGDSALVHLWRRLTARTPRGFDAAFAGVFPGTPAELYARWTAEVTGEALGQERRLRDAGLVEGALVQRLAGYTGDPAVSPDGRHVAVELRPSTGGGSGAPRIVVWRVGADSTDARADSVRRARAEAARGRDPEDVPAIAYRPAPKRAVATLPAIDGRSFTTPRFLPDGRRVLVVRDEPRADGTTRPDLWLWDRARGPRALRRVTHGAAVRSPDPSPDGRSALAVRCVAGWCDVVRVDLARGDVAPVLAGSPDVTYARPRWAPDGRRFVVAEQRGGRWRVLLGDVAGGAPRPLGPDDGADRYDAAFLPADEAVVVTSERGGVPNLERIDVATGAVRPLTRVTGAAVAPAPIAGTTALLYLSLTSRGLDLRRLPLDSVPASLDVVPLTPAAVAATASHPDAAAGILQRPAAPTAAFDAAALGAARGYGLGPRRFVLLPGGAGTADGASAMGLLASADPVGRLTWTLQGAVGDARTWNGGALSVALRALAPTLEAQAFGVAQRVAPPGDATPLDVSPGEFRDRVRYHGGALGATLARAFPSSAVRLRAGGSLGTVRADLAPDAAARRLAFVDGAASVRRGRGDLLATLSVGAHAAAGETGDSAYVRALGTATLALRGKAGGVRAAYARGVVGRDAPAFERFLVGGAESALVDASVLAQRVAMPALPTGIVGGREIETARLALTGGLVEPYWWMARAPDASSRWRRVVGAEATFATGTIPFARAPGVRVVGGVGYSLDAPLRREWRGYASVVVRP